MGIEPGADELRMRAILVAHEVGPDAVPPKPTERPKDWLDDIFDDDLAPEPEDADEEGEPGPADGPEPGKTPKPARKRRAEKPRKRKQKQPKPGTPRAGADTRPAPTRQALADAWDSIPPRLKWLAYHASAAYLGWSMGLVGWSRYVTGWIADTGLVGPQAVFWYVVAAGTVLVYRRTRSWWTPVAWLAAVPVTSTVVGVLLYAPHP